MAWKFIIILLKAKMKNSLVILFILFFGLLSCNNNNDKKTPTYRNVNVKNVNGNIPDTTNAIDLSRKKTDTASSADTSVRH